jgi:shikimate kinase
VALVGFMGAGKTCVGRLLAERLSMPFVDLDQYIEEREQMTVPLIFAEGGEVGFRKAEQEALEAVLGRDPCVLACGGGTPCQPGAMEQLMAWGHTIFLDVSWEKLSSRNLVGRPLWGDTAEKLLIARRPVYQKAHICLDASQEIPQLVEAAVTCLALRV